MQTDRVYNSTPFRANISIKDSGKCLSLYQRARLKQTAKNVGENSDKIFIGTRKYDNIDVFSGKHFKRQDGVVLSLVDNKVVDMRFDSKNMFEDMEEYLKTFSNDGHNYSVIRPEKVSEAISDMKDQIKEFCSLKRTYHRVSLGEMLKNTFTSKPNPEKIARKAKEKQEFQDWLTHERYKKETQEDVDLIGSFYDTFIKPVKEEFF